MTIKDLDKDNSKNLYKMHCLGNTTLYTSHDVNYTSPCVIPMSVLLYMGLNVMLWIWTKILLVRPYSSGYDNDLWTVCTILHFSQFLWRISCNQYTFSICLYNLNWETGLLRWRTRASSLGKLMCEGGKELAAWVGCVGQRWKAEVWVLINAKMGKHILKLTRAVLILRRADLQLIWSLFLEPSWSVGCLTAGNCWTNEWERLLYTKPFSKCGSTVQPGEGLRAS